MKRTAGFRIVGIGEVLWDLFPEGRQLGGAPANVVFHARALGTDARLVTRLGTDEPGNAALEKLSAQGIPLDGVQRDPAAPTGSATVEMAEDGTHRFTLHENVAWDRLEAATAAIDMVRAAHAVCFGTLAQRTEAGRAGVRAIVSAASRNAVRLLDLNLRAPFHSPELIESSLQMANALRLNDEELALLAAQYGLSGRIRDQLAALSAKFNLRFVSLTRGPNGSMMFAGGEWAEHPGFSIKLADTVGAGDAFTAAVIVGWLLGWTIEKLNKRANDISAFVCTQKGATPALPEHLVEAYTR